MVLAYLLYSSVTIAGVAIGWWFYARSQAEVPRLYAKPSKLKMALLDNSKVLKQKYYPPFWCVWGSVHTVMRQFLRSCPQLPYNREILKMEDGGQVALDWLEPEKKSDKGPETPIVILLPGLTGSSDDGYVIHMAMAVAENGYRGVVFNNRGNGGIELLTPQTYSAAYTDDLKSVVGHVRQRYPEAKVMAAGFSLGGMILFNYVSKYSAEECGLKAAMVVSSPWDPFVATKSLNQPVNRVLFNYRLASNLCKLLERNRKIFEKVLDVEHVLKSEVISDFDERFIVPVFKYKDLPAYYHDAGLYYKVKLASVPILCLNSADDIFSPIESIPLADVQESDNVMSVITAHGGHIAYMKEEAMRDGGLIEDLFGEYAKIVFNLL